MSLLTVWTTLFASLFCLHAYRVFNKDFVKDDTIKSILVLGYLIAAQACFYLPELVYQVNWTVNEIDLMWGWSIGNKELLLISIMFAVGVYSKDYSARALLWSGLASAVIISSYHYQAALLFALMGYLYISQRKRNKKSLIYPTVLLGFMSFEILWQKSQFLSLPEYFGGSGLEIIICGIVLMFVYHIINLLSSKKELKATDLIVVTVSQYVTTDIMSEYMATDFMVTALVVMSVAWTAVVFIGLNSKSLSLAPGYAIKLLIIQFSIFGLLPDSSNISFFVILIMGLLELYSRDEAKRDIDLGFPQVEKIFITILRAMAPLSWSGLWPIYLLIDKSGLEFYAEVSLTMSTVLYGLVVMTRTNFQVKLDNLKTYKHDHLLTLLKIVVFFGLLSFPIKKMLMNVEEWGLDGLLTSPAYWIITLVWLLIILQRAYVKESSQVYVLFSGMKNSMPTQSLSAVSNIMESLRDSGIYFVIIVVKTMSLFPLLVWRGLKNIMLVVANALSKFLLELISKQELICLLTVSAFFMFYIWRYSA